MPLFDYFCKKCSKIFEINVRLDKLDKKIRCPYCEKGLKKVVSAPKIIRIN